MKKCTRCLEIKDAYCFSKRSDRDSLRSWCKQCMCQNKNRYKEQQKRHYQQNKEIYALKSKEYKLKNKDKIRSYQKKYENSRLKNDAIFKLTKYRRNRRYEALSANSNGFISDLNCTIKFWKSYLEQRFDENMTWENYGKYWHLDEIIPCSAWDLTNPIEQRACFHYMNSQPLEKFANLSKGGANLKDYTKEKAQFLMVLRALGEI